eukprot:snap_masked-scaffold_1-processed-gene-3.22-mRNA-1 protein AED:0.02 eAED:0.02 QI:0/-1/0/1/-1/1/1/0/353
MNRTPLNVLDLPSSPGKTLLTKKRTARCDLTEQNKKLKLDTQCSDFSVREDSRLKQLFEEYGKNWTKIANQLKKSPEVCEQRWRMKIYKKRGAWSPEEDAMLIELVKKLDKSNWGDLAIHIEGRSAKQCRERWFFNLDPSIKKTEWTKAEDELLLSLQKAEGNCWARISTHLPGRTENAVKTRYKSLQRQKKRDWSYDEDKKLLLLQHKYGCKWDRISREMGSRTKNAVKIRYRLLKKNPETFSNCIDMLLKPRNIEQEACSETSSQTMESLPAQSAANLADFSGLAGLNQPVDLQSSLSINLEQQLLLSVLLQNQVTTPLDTLSTLSCLNQSIIDKAKLELLANLISGSTNL